MISDTFPLLIRTAGEVESLKAAQPVWEPVPLPQKVLLCSPDWFDVIDVKNTHMEGNAGKVEKTLAMKQWQDLRSIYQELVKQEYIQEVLEITPGQEMEDMVFTANQSFPWQTKAGEKVVILSNMRHASRQREVPLFEKFYQQRGYRLLRLPESIGFESMGDCLHLNSRLLIGGSGYRTDSGAYSLVSELLQTPVLVLDLVDPRFYHLDTCLLLLELGDQKIGLACKNAFSANSWTALDALLDELIPVSETEAAEGFALNAHFLPHPGDGVPVAISQKGNPETSAQLQALGIRIIETETSEFMKSGGSVFCMKMMLW